jgi:hypothetical protein
MEEALTGLTSSRRTAECRFIDRIIIITVTDTFAIKTIMMIIISHWYFVLGF